MAWGPASRQAEAEFQSPLTNSGLRVARAPGGLARDPRPHIHTHASRTGLAVEDNPQKALRGPFSQPMSDPWRVWNNSSLLRPPLGSTNPREERKGRIELRSVHVVKVGAESLTRVEETCCCGLRRPDGYFVVTWCQSIEHGCLRQ